MVKTVRKTYSSALRLTDYLLDLTDNPNLSDFVLSEKENMIINNYRSFDDTNKIKVETYIEAIKDLYK